MDKTHTPPQSDERDFNDVIAQVSFPSTVPVLFALPGSKSLPKEAQNNKLKAVSFCM